MSQQTKLAAFFQGESQRIEEAVTADLSSEDESGSDVREDHI